MWRCAEYQQESKKRYRLERDAFEAQVNTIANTLQQEFEHKENALQSTIDEQKAKILSLEKQLRTQGADQAGQISGLTSKLKKSTASHAALKSEHNALIVKLAATRGDLESKMKASASDASKVQNYTVTIISPQQLAHTRSGGCIPWLCYCGHFGVVAVWLLLLSCCTRAANANWVLGTGHWALGRAYLTIHCIFFYGAQ